MRFPSPQSAIVQSICNVYGTKVIKTTVDRAGVTTKVIDRATKYNSDITGAIMMRKLLESVSDQFVTTHGPTDAPVLEVKGFVNVGAEVLLYRRSAGNIEQNLDASSIKIENFITGNCY
jgi:hypothetical protein